MVMPINSSRHCPHHKCLLYNITDMVE